MKILWITNMIVGDLALERGIKLTSGQWLNAEIDNEKRDGKNELVICTSANEATELCKDNIKYIVLSHGPVSLYSVSEEKILEWKSVFETEKPDLILVWGTEYDIGKCALIANDRKIPALIYIQGVMSSVAENYRGGLCDKEIKAFTTLFEKIRKTTVWDLEKRQCMRAEIERECIKLASGVVLENTWAEEQYKKISSDLKIFKSRLPIKKEFAEHNWREGEFEKHSIVTTAANYPLKGLHKLLLAIKLLKVKYPDVKLYVPGPNNVTTKGLRATITRSGYCRKIAKDIKKYGITENVVFVGPLSTEQYAERMRKSNVFVSASAIENHCSALREAMSAGVPCVASKVGGIPEYATHGENVSLYEFCDHESLADRICELFENEDLRRKYSENGKAKIKRMYSEENLASLGDIYKEICNA